MTILEIEEHIDAVGSCDWEPTGVNDERVSSLKASFSSSVVVVFLERSLLVRET